jgi:hypothetical protein
MAAAYAHSDRCLGLGLNAPLLPTAVCKEAENGTSASGEVRENARRALDDCPD